MVTEDWCDFGDLPVSQCAHCRGDVAPVKQGAAIVASYDGRCALGCDVPIMPGDMIVWSDAKAAWMHEDCEA